MVSTTSTAGAGHRDVARAGHDADALGAAGEQHDARAGLEQHPRGVGRAALRVEPGDVLLGDLDHVAAAEHAAAGARR